GRVYSLQIALVNAAREGARYCALYPSAPTNLSTRVSEELGTYASALSAAPTCTVSFDPTNPANPRFAVVSLAASFVPVTPLVGSIAGGPLAISASATMPV
ncbi:MAG TPA: hypothetical protein VFX49_07745, partial [Chloroflexota bacterium]|nr:hypothetical protein [Chloroflexota bacterium]